MLALLSSSLLQQKLTKINSRILCSAQCRIRINCEGKENCLMSHDQRLSLRMMNDFIAKQSPMAIGKPGFHLQPMPYSGALSPSISIHKVHYLEVHMAQQNLRLVGCNQHPWMHHLQLLFMQNRKVQSIFPWKILVKFFFLRENTSVRKEKKMQTDLYNKAEMSKQRQIKDLEE